MSKLKCINVGTMYFDGEKDKITVTDPGYDDDIWCKIDIENLKTGTYNCYVWLDEKNSRIMRNGIYLIGQPVVPTYSLTEIGEIGVDSGMAGFFKNKPNYNRDEWYKFCDDLFTTDKYCPKYPLFAYIMPEGFFSSSGYGDGCYIVYGYKNKGELTAVEIQF